ncbi:MAG: class I SAM-dependent methyltransferase [Candidatus Jorgensenbacteria bacterium]|nr:class I SAM-dependent methyltransferase [Candidatus Jorgensenbacteria bacterium]
MNENILVKILGYAATILHGDVAVFDRWMWLRRNLKSGLLRTLDAGCGSGSFTMYAAKRGNDAVGISFDERNNKIAEERARLLRIANARFITGDLRKLDEIGKTLGLFDQIICFETIEHILDDEKLVRNFSGLLKPGGTLLLTAPYKYYYKHLLGDDKTPISSYEDGGHVRLGYTHEDLEKIFNKAGIVLVKREYVSGIITALQMALFRFLQRKINFRVVWFLVFPLRVLFLVDPFITWATHCSHLTVAVTGIKKI